MRRSWLLRGRAPLEPLGGHSLLGHEAALGGSRQKAWAIVCRCSLPLGCLPQNAYGINPGAKTHSQLPPPPCTRIPPLLRSSEHCSGVLRRFKWTLQGPESRTGKRRSCPKVQTHLLFASLPQQPPHRFLHTPAGRGRRTSAAVLAE